MPLSAQHIQIQSCSRIIKVLTNIYNTVYPHSVNLLSAKLRKWSNKLKAIRRQQPTIFLSVFDYFVVLVIKRVTRQD